VREPSIGATDQRSAAAVMKIKTLVFEQNQCGSWRKIKSKLRNMVTLITPRSQIKKKLRNTVRVAERLMKLAKSLRLGKATHGGRHDTVSESATSRGVLAH
jgi:hypothetical protein